MKFIIGIKTGQSNIIKEESENKGQHLSKGYSYHELDYHLENETKKL